MSNIAIGPRLFTIFPSLEKLQYRPQIGLLLNLHFFNVKLLSNNFLKLISKTTILIIDFN